MMKARPGSVISVLTGRLHFMGTAEAYSGAPRGGAVSGALPNAPHAPARRGPLSLAMAASVGLHAALAVFAFGIVGAPHALRGAHAPVLQATLVAPSKPAYERIAVERLAALRVPAPAALKRMIEPALPAPAVEPAAAPVRAGSGFVPLDVEATVLADRERLGELQVRDITQFPVEIGTLPRIDGTIRARYPTDALAAGREGSVVLWVVVDETGKADNIIVAEGPDEFAEEAMNATRAAHFIPARNNLEPIAYPIALEFRFVLDDAPSASPLAAVR